MPSSVQELNVYLFDQLEVIEDALELAREEGSSKTEAFLLKAKSRVERKLYQDPPILHEG